MARFTAQTALLAAQHSVASRANARLAAAQRPPEPPQASLSTKPVDDFIIRKLARVRGQIDAVEKLLDKAIDPQAVDRYCNALTRLYAVERILAGRPLPGSRRPKSDDDTRRRPASRTALLDDESAPVAQVAPPPGPALPVKPLGWEYDDPVKVPEKPPEVIP